VEGLNDAADAMATNLESLDHRRAASPAAPAPDVAAVKGERE